MAELIVIGVSIKSRVRVGAALFSVRINIRLGLALTVVSAILDDLWCLGRPRNKRTKYAINNAASILTAVTASIQKLVTYSSDLSNIVLSKPPVLEATMYDSGFSTFSDTNFQISYNVQMLHKPIVVIIHCTNVHVRSTYVV